MGTPTTNVHRFVQPFFDFKGCIRAYWPSESELREAVTLWIRSKCPGSSEKRERLMWSAGVLYDNLMHQESGAADKFIEALEAEMNEIIPKQA